MNNCPFYGYAMHLSQAKFRPQEGLVPPFLLLTTHGNQCALLIEAHSPCQMEIAQQMPDWKTCRLVRQIQGEA